MMKKYYESPSLAITEIKVEAGIAVSSTYGGQAETGSIEYDPDENIHIF